jgi:DNA-binding LytR/AlgR family response regulator
MDVIRMVVKGTKRIDLLLSDIVMRGRNWREPAEKAKKIRKGMPILFMTGSSRNAVIILTIQRMDGERVCLSSAALAMCRGILVGAAWAGDIKKPRQRGD